MAAKKRQTKEMTYSSRSSFLHSHHLASGSRQSLNLHITHWLDDKSTLVNIGVNFQLHASPRDQISPMSIWQLNRNKNHAYEGTNMYPLPLDGNYYRKRICHQQRQCTVVGWKVWPVSNFAQQEVQQEVQTDTTCNIQQCWELLANNVASVCTGL